MDTIKSKRGFTVLAQSVFWWLVAIVAALTILTITKGWWWNVFIILFVLYVLVDDYIKGYLKSPNIEFSDKGFMVKYAGQSNKLIRWEDIYSWEIENDGLEPRMPVVRIKCKQNEDIILRMQFYRNMPELIQALEWGHWTWRVEGRVYFSRFSPKTIIPFSPKEQQEISQQKFQLIFKRLRDAGKGHSFFGAPLLGAFIFSLGIVVGIATGQTNILFYLCLVPWLLLSLYELQRKWVVYGISEKYLMCKQQFLCGRTNYYRIEDLRYATVTLTSTRQSRNYKLYLLLNDYSLHKYSVSNLTSQDTKRLEQLLSQKVKFVNAIDNTTFQ